MFNTFTLGDFFFWLLVAILVALFLILWNYSQPYRRFRLEQQKKRTRRRKNCKCD